MSRAGVLGILFPVLPCLCLVPLLLNLQLEPADRPSLHIPDPAHTFIHSHTCLSIAWWYGLQFIILGIAIATGYVDVGNYRYAPQPLPEPMH